MSQDIEFHGDPNQFGEAQDHLAYIAAIAGKKRTITHGDGISEKRNALLRAREDIIPSADMRQFLTQENICFRDKEIVTIGYNEIVLKKDKRSWLKLMEKETGETWESSDIYEDIFVDIPIPFKHGDLVRHVTKGWRGIMMGCEPVREELRQNHLVDYSDTALRAEWLDETGEFFHSHVSPFVVERFRPVKGDADYDVLIEAEQLAKGLGGSFEVFQIFCKRYARQNAAKSTGAEV